jgi:hypothetical protein
MQVSGTVLQTKLKNYDILSLLQISRVKFFCKLPHWFEVLTPFGGYNPDWDRATCRSFGRNDDQCSFERVFCKGADILTVDIPETKMVSM